jgi:hypothetical protein
VRKKPIVLLVVFVGVLGLVLWQVKGPNEPVYQNRSMTGWLRELEQWSGDTNDAAFIAFAEMGPAAIPPLLEILRSGGPNWKRAIMRLNQKQSVVRFPFGQPWHETTAATWALYAMGTNARSALPVLTNLLFLARQ